MELSYDYFPTDGPVADLLLREAVFWEAGYRKSDASSGTEVRYLYSAAIGFPDLRYGIYLLDLRGVSRPAGCGTSNAVPGKWFCTKPLAGRYNRETPK